MDKGNLVGTIIMAICCFGCGILFLCIGLHASKAEKPVNFWSGVSVPAEKVSDVLSYNHACAIMWKVYAIPYFIAGVIGCLDFSGDMPIMISSILLFAAACFPGLPLLIWQYRRIEKKYISR